MFEYTEYNEKEIFDIISDKQIFWTLKAIIDDDCYLGEFIEAPILETFLSLLVHYKIVWIASDDRILLTNYGNKLFYEMSLSHVELDKKPTKVKKKLIWKPKTTN